MLPKKTNVIKSKRIYLKNFTKKNLIKRYFNWFKDDGHLKFSRHKKKNYKYNYFLNYYLSIKKAKNLFFAIYTIKKDFFLGTITANIDNEKKSADIGILIGEKKYQNKAIGTKAIQKLLKKLKQQKIKSIITYVSKKNKQSIKFFKKNNFREYNNVKYFLKIKKNTYSILKLNI